MTDEPALLAAVAAAPDDDTPRLVYADWLDDHGRADRAAFVRVQCRLAAATPAAADYPDLLDREAELAARLAAAEPPPPQPGGPFRVEDDDYNAYARGFPAVATWSGGGDPGEDARRLLAALETHLPASPARSLRVYGLDGAGVAALVGRPVAAGLRGLAVTVNDEDFALEFAPVGGGNLGMYARSPAANAVAAAVAASPHLAGLRRLSLYVGLTDEAAPALTRAALPGLAELRLGVAAASPRAVAGLAGAGWFHGVRVLGYGDRLGVAHLEALAALPPFPRLHTLDLSHNRFEWIGLRALAESQAFPALAALDLGHNPLGDEGAGYLGAAGWSVRELNLTLCGIGDAGVRALLAGRLLDGVRVLDLGNNDLSAAGAAALAASPKLAGVRHLGLADNRIGAGGLAALAASPHLRHLTRLDVGTTPGAGNRVAAADVAAFLTALDAPHLGRLTLDGLPVGLPGARALAARPASANLRALGLRGCRLGPKAVAALAAAPHLRGVVELDVAENSGAPPAGMTNFQ